MATATKPQQDAGTKHLIDYRTEGGLAILELNDPPLHRFGVV